MRPEAQAWWELARQDAETAKIVLEAGSFYMTAFLSQQCAEKGLKAVWIAQKRKLAPKTHNLMDLAEELGIAMEFDSQLKRLNPQYVAPRYPDAANGVPYRNYNREIAQALLNDAQEIMSWCQSQLEQS